MHSLYRPALLAALLATVLCSCSDDDPPPPPPGPPVANAGAPQNADTGATVTLNGSASAGNALIYAWMEITTSGVTINNADMAVANFTAPAAPAVLIFELTVTDTAGFTSRAATAVVVTAAANNAPTANAGADQTVQVSATVTLTGSGSDPDGDPLTYAWTETSPSGVTINDADMAVANFTAPAAPATLTFELLVSDGMANDTDTTTVTVENTPTPQTATLYVVNESGSLLGFADPATLDGNQAPTTNLTGQATGLVNPADVVADAMGASITSVATAGQPEIHVSLNSFDFGATGNVAPDRAVSKLDTTLNEPDRLALDRAGDRLFVADSALGLIWIYDRVSDASFNGMREPDRGLIWLNNGSPLRLTAGGMDYGPDGTLYVVGPMNRIERFPNAANGGEIESMPVILTDPTAIDLRSDVFVDGNDVMYVTGRVDRGDILVWDNASGLPTTPVAPSRTISVDLSLHPGSTTELTGIAVDSNNVGYVSDRLGRIWVFDNIHTLNGSIMPDRSIEGPGTMLDCPQELTILE